MGTTLTLILKTSSQHVEITASEGWFDTFGENFTKQAMLDYGMSQLAAEEHKNVRQCWLYV